jgi:hypothetical protein
MKWLMAMISKGRDVSSFYPDVVKLPMTTKKVELKKLQEQVLSRALARARASSPERHGPAMEHHSRVLQSG